MAYFDVVTGHPKYPLPSRRLMPRDWDDLRQCYSTNPAERASKPLAVRCADKPTHPRNEYADVGLAARVNITVALYMKL